MELWDFQLEAAELCRHRYRREDRLLLCSPTGSGKTIMACELARLSISKGKRVCILVDRIEILGQFLRALKLFNLYPELITAGSGRPRHSSLYLGMVESFYNRLDKYETIDGIDFLVFDEAHSTAYFKIIKKLKPKQKVLALTATPVLTGTKERLNDHYDGIVELAKVEDLIKRGKLCNSQTFSIDLLEERRLKRKRGDFTEDSQIEMFSTIRDGAVQNFKRICGHARFICYNINVEHSKATCANFNFHGIKCAHVDGETDKEERRRIFRQLADGEIQGVHNFGICTTGFDEPSVECIIQNFATNSLAKHIQTAGRGARIFPGKSKFYILDMGRNFSRHGLWNKDKNWTDIFNNPKEADERDRQATERIHNINCPTCGYIVEPAYESCPICSTSIKEILASKTKNAIQVGSAAELRLVKEQAKASLPEHLKNRDVKTMSHGELKEYAAHMGYNPKWVYVMLNNSKRKYLQDNFG